MPAGADLLVTGAADLQDEFNGPVSYSDRWWWLALLGLVLVAAYYSAVLWFTRRREQPAPVTWRRSDVPSTRQRHLDRIAHVDGEVRAGRLSPREGHQQLSEIVRSYVGEVSTLPAPTMALADFRQHAPAALVNAIELMYPPEFAPDGAGEARERFDDAVLHARYLVASWS